MAAVNLVQPSSPKALAEKCHQTFTKPKLTTLVIKVGAAAKRSMLTLGPECSNRPRRMFAYKMQQSD